MAAWDWFAPLRIGPAHSGPIPAVATARLEDGRTLIISGGDDWSVILWLLQPNGQIADELTLAPRVRALSAVDDETVGDALNRGVLAAHLEGLLVQLTTKQRTGTAVVHIDGKWGAQAKAPWPARYSPRRPPWPPSDLLYALWTALRRHQPRRPVLLVIDDLDRCSAERVVKLMETVHTLLREPAETRLLRSLRRPAPLIALVLADGRWIRTAFETTYESFGTLGSPVHGLGADFLQKVFDHTVLVPALAADQVQTYVDHVTGTSAWAIASRTVADQGPNLIPTQALSTPGQSVTDTNGQAQSPRGEVEEPLPIPAAAAPDPAPTAPDPAPVGLATQRAERLIAEAAPGEVHNQSIRAALDDTTGKERERLAEDIAAKATTTEALAAFTEDLLTRYTPLMPANPRLIKRIANAFGMLLALGLHLGHHEDEDTVARAAILLVRFPTLLDDLLSAPDPPVLDPPVNASPTDPASPWLRRDVQQVLREPTAAKSTSPRSPAATAGTTHLTPPAHRHTSTHQLPPDQSAK